MFETKTQSYEGADGAPGFTITRSGGAPRPPRIDLTEFTTEAVLDALAAEQEQDRRRKGVPKRRYDPAWKPRRKKGEPLDKDGEAHQRAVAAAMQGLPGSPTWCEVQCFDNGPAEGRHAHTRYVLKVTWTAAAAGALVGEDKRALSQTRYVRLCVAKAFVKNCRRKAERHALDAAEHATVARLVALMAQITAVAPEGAPEPLIGAPFTRLRGEGVLRTPRNFALMGWQPTA